MLLDMGGVITLGDAVTIGAAVSAPMGWLLRRASRKVDEVAEALGELSRLAASQCEVNRATAHLLEVHGSRIGRVESKMMEM